MYAFSENFMLPMSHDEVVHMKGSLINKMPGDSWRQFANLRLLYAYMWAHPGKKLLFMGAELAQRAEWKFAGELEWPLLEHESHRGVARLLADLNRLYRREPAFHEVEFEWTGFQWLDCNDADHSVLSFLRKAKSGETILVVLNFTPVVRHHYLIGLPEAGFFREIFNTDADIYWGSNTGNVGGARATAVPHQHWPYSVALTLPPLGACFFKLESA
jgi:1,4-alpha-glucan branching enzyme